MPGWCYHASRWLYGSRLARRLFLVCEHTTTVGDISRRLWILVAGYSWVNTHVNGFGNPGYGIGLSWKRAYVLIDRLPSLPHILISSVLVLVGFTAGFIVMLFPNPTTSRVLVRKSMAAIMNEIGHIFATEVEDFIGEEASGKKEIDINMTKGDEVVAEKVSDKEERIKKTGKMALAVAVR